jgi:tRNA pseudouridine55 synthase
MINGHFIMKKKTFTFDSVFGVYKSKGPTSNDILEKLRQLTGIRKIGHAGTLDPLAKGVLVVGVGKGTKLLADIVGKEKEYLAKIKFGETSETDDSEGKKNKN